MRSFRARIERGRIIVHEPVDVPDGVVYLAVVEEAKRDGEPARSVEQKVSARPAPPPAVETDHRSSS